MMMSLEIPTPFLAALSGSFEEILIHAPLVKNIHLSLRNMQINIDDGYIVIKADIHRGGSSLCKTIVKFRLVVINGDLEIDELSTTTTPNVCSWIVDNLSKWFRQCIKDNLNTKLNGIVGDKVKFTRLVIGHNICLAWSVND